MRDTSAPACLARWLALAGLVLAAGTAAIVGLGLGFLLIGSGPFFWGGVAFVLFALPALLLALAFLALHQSHAHAPRERT